jgi:hypothetical protein
MQQPRTPPSVVRRPVRARRLIILAIAACIAAIAFVLVTVATTPSNTDDPEGLAQYEPVSPRAETGLEAPLGFTDCAAPRVRSGRDHAGDDQHAVTPKIDRFVIHHTGALDDQLDYFSSCNDRSSAPTFYVRTDGSVYELIRPGAKPASTGPDWNWRSLAVETLDSTGAPDYDVTNAQIEEFAQMIAWLATFDGGSLDGVPVSFTIDREHVVSHREALPGTECPGDFLQGRLDQIVERARQIYDEDR